MARFKIRYLFVAIVVCGILLAALFLLYGILLASHHPSPYRICDKTTLAVLAVHTTPKRFPLRKAFRNLWKRWGGQVLPVFFVGRSGKEKVDDLIIREYQIYQDIVMLNHTESFRNRTLKVIGWMRWVNEHCSRTPFVLKVDDDIFVDPFRFVRYLEKLKDSEHHPGMNFVCKERKLTPVERNIFSKVYLSDKEFPHPYFPPYCSGCAYLLPTGVIPKLLSAHVNMPFFRIDDVYVTGMLAAQAGIGRQPSEELVCTDTLNSAQEILEGKMLARITGDNEPDTFLKLIDVVERRENGLFRSHADGL